MYKFFKASTFTSKTNTIINMTIFWKVTSSIAAKTWSIIHNL